MEDSMTIKDASIWASEYIGKNVTPSNISYLIQYGRIQKNGDNGNTFVNMYDLEEYYKSHLETKEDRWKKQLWNKFAFIRMQSVNMFCCFRFFIFRKG